MAYRVLLIDDSLIVRKMLKKTLDLTPINVSDIFEAANGKEGLAIARNEWIDLVFLDINMPVMNGMEFMRALRIDQEIKDTPVIVVSTEGSQERRTELENLNVKSFIRKPVSPEDLCEAIISVIGEENNGN